MNDDTNLSGMDHAAAQEYILAFMTTLKQTEQEIARLEAEEATWRQRAQLAAEKGRADLAEQALIQAEASKSKRAPLESERAELASKIEAMRSQLPMLKAGERSVDPDALLVSLQMANGDFGNEGAAEARAADASIAGLGAESELDQLKKKMGMAPPSPEPAPETPPPPSPSEETTEE
jgi:phage shock protein A